MFHFSKIMFVHVDCCFAANLVHTGIVNMSSVSEFSKSCQDDMEFGNRMAVLSGDFLLASACTGLAELRDTEVVCAISEVIGHLMEGEFLKITCDANSLNLDFWNELVFKCKGSLMANSCKAALKLVSHSKEVRTCYFTLFSEDTLQSMSYMVNAGLFCSHFDPPTANLI